MSNHTNDVLVQVRRKSIVHTFGEFIKPSLHVYVNKIGQQTIFEKCYSYVEIEPRVQSIEINNMNRSTHWIIFYAWPFAMFSHAMITGHIISSLLSGGSPTSNDDSVIGRRSFLDKENVNITPHIRIAIYTGSSMDTADIMNLAMHETDRMYLLIDRSKPLVLYIHGFREHPADESVRTIVGAHLERGNDNVMLLDWSDLAFDNYIAVVGKTPDIAKTLAHTLDELVNLGLDLEKFHCIGHSLGAQIAGFFGKYSNNLLPRITGLDPANPGFYYPGAKHIDGQSARFVDIIHTDGGHYGTLEPTGTVDFFPNKGTRPQPGCLFLAVPFSSSATGDLGAIMPRAC